MRIIPLILILTGCTSLESVVEACQSQGGHTVIVVNPDVTEIRGVRCEYPI